MISSTLLLLATILMGASFWTFSEYALHNWYGHLAKGSNDFSREHLKHHALAHYFAPPWKKFRAAGVALAILTPLAILCFGPVHGIVFSLSFVSAYLGYEWLHRRAHTHPPTGTYGRWMRKHHFSHHFNNPKHNHGVTSNIWDRAFGTLRTINKVRVPRKHAMVWLLCSKTGDVLPEFQSDYVLVEVRR